MAKSFFGTAVIHDPHAMQVNIGTWHKVRADVASTVNRDVAGHGQIAEIWEITKNGINTSGVSYNFILNQGFRHVRLRASVRKNSHASEDESKMATVSLTGLDDYQSIDTGGVLANKVAEVELSSEWKIVEVYLSIPEGSKVKEIQAFIGHHFSNSDGSIILVSDDVSIEVW